jgi:transcriptional regulator with XRE-family HTH domain
MNDPRKDEFAAWFKEAFNRTGLSERQFAIRMGVASTTPRAWRMGFSLPTFERCASIADALGISAELVRAKAGYGGASEPIQEDFQLAELLAHWQHLSLSGREAVLATAKALVGGRA